MSIAQQLMPIYNPTVHKNKINVALYLMWLLVTFGVMRHPTGHMGPKAEEKWEEEKGTSSAKIIFSKN